MKSKLLFHRLGELSQTMILKKAAVQLPDFETMMKESGGAYYDVNVGTQKTNGRVGRFTAYIYMEPESVKDDMADEEVDIDALSEKHAKEIFSLAWARDYEGKPLKVKFRQQYGMYL